MTKLTEILFKQKNSFLPIYGRNCSQKNGRAIEKNPPTFMSIFKDEEKKENRKIKAKELNCKDEIDEIMNCLLTNGKDKLNLCADKLKNLRDCYHRSYEDDFAVKMYNAQLEFILKNLSKLIENGLEPLLERGDSDPYMNFESEETDIEYEGEEELMDAYQDENS